MKRIEKIANRIIGGNATEWKRMIEMANNSMFLNREKGKKGTGDVYVFSATKGSANGILKDVEKKYPQNEVVMNIRKRYSYGNVYEIYLILGDK